MELNVQYVTNKKGRATAVQVPIKDWKLLMDDYAKTKQFAKLKKDLTEAVKEIEEIKAGKKKVVTLNEFLHEL